ncbi:pyruvate kinase [Butyrivibrio fibrisolvens]|jgi:pyruvate kinase|uniref:Pyruvate kinase n=1 Tax=Butyrivibrio fibrisolvens TaxID=831 RepID=A0A1H9X003_BUTFI|nr:MULTISPECIES: pyruvate kinase [Butyrivibrio]MCR4635068.1 pyruvate kinase [Butyrivibrio sp.]SES39419.1 pyruvate kinase [Butyrivibrio fibrisolvens]
MRKTKIICTIGPASSSEEVLTQMCEAGMNVARLNFSHGDHEEQLGKIKVINKVRDKMGLPIAIMLDTKGPEYRIGVFKDHKATLEEGQEFTFTVDDIVGDNQKVSVSYKGFAQDLKKGDTILVNNGLVICEVTKVKGNDVITKVIAGGTLSDKKSMNFPGKVLKQAYLSDQDKADLLFGIEHDIDYVAASFVSTRQDAQDLRDFLDKNGGRDIDIIAKIENRSGVENIEEISEVVDGIMVARGDLGVEIPFMEVPSVQKEIVQKCRLLGKRVIIATEMLESMITNVRPTRAEISDVANAVYDGASAIMLSGESAAGKYPVEAVKTMSEVAEYTEQHINYTKRFKNMDFSIRNNLDAISHSTCSMAIDVDAKCIVVSSISGLTARMVSRFRCPVEIIGMTTSVKAFRKLALSWGVYPLLCDEFESLDVLFFHAMQQATKILDLKMGDNVVLTGGKIGGTSGHTNMIKVETIHKIYS